MAVVDQAAKKAAQRQFASAFPNFGDVRVVAAHPSEINDEPGKQNVNSIKIHQTSLCIVSSIIEQNYTSTFKGKLVSYEVNANSSLALRKVLEHWVTAFSPAEKLTVSLAREQSQGIARLNAVDKSGHQ